MMMRRFRAMLAACLAALMLLAPAAPITNTAEAGESFSPAQSVRIARSKKKKKNATPTPSAETAPTETPAPTGTPEAAAAVSPVPDGPIIDPQSIADWIFAHPGWKDPVDALPGNFITKNEAKRLGWDSYYNYVSDVAPGKSIGGDRFGNYEGQLPSAKGRQYYECDCWYTGGKRNAYRIIFSNDGLVYYTQDHYNSFIELFPSDVATNVPPTPTPRYRR